MFDILTPYETAEKFGFIGILLGIVLYGIAKIFHWYFKKHKQSIEEIAQINKATVLRDSSGNVMNIPRIVQDEYEVLCNPTNCPFHLEIKNLLKGKGTELDNLYHEKHTEVLKTIQSRAANLDELYKSNHAELRKLTTQTHDMMKHFADDAISAREKTHLVISKMDEDIRESTLRQKEISDELIGFIRTVVERLLNGKSKS